MASTNYINECKNRANGNKLGKIKIANKTLFQGKNISIKNSLGSSDIDLTLYGYTKQETSIDPLIPSLDYPSKIDVVKDNVEIKLIAKNLIHLNESATKLGVTITNNNDGTITLNGTANANMDFWFANGTNVYATDYSYKFSKGTELTQEKNIVSGTYTGKFELKTVTYDNNTATLRWQEIINDITTTIDFDGETRGIELYIFKDTTFDNLTLFPQLEVGTNATEPELYQSSSVTINLKDNELCSLSNDIKDAVNIKNGIVKINKKIRHLRLAIADMNNNDLYPGWTNQTQLKEDYPKLNASFDFYGIKIISSITNDSTNIGLNTNSSGLLMFMPKFFGGMTQTEIKEKYPDLVVDFYYEMPEIEQIELGTINELKAFEGVTNISNDLDCDMDIEVQSWNKEITNHDNLQSIEIDSGCYVDGNIIGSVYAKCLKASFIADQNNLTDKSMQAQIGVKYADLSEESINMGKYTIEHQNSEITAQYSQITAYSDLYTNLDTKYVCNIDYSSGDKTVSDLYVDVCNQLGLTPKTTEFINSTIPITANPFTNGEKNRTVLQTIAKIACSFVDIDNDTNKIDLCWLSGSEEPDYIFNLNDYSSVEGGQVVCGPINCLIIKNSQIDDENVTIKDEKSIVANGEHSIIISEDYILHNAELREQAITDIWSRVKGMKYVDCKLTTYYGKPFLKLGAKIRNYTSDTEYFDTYVLKHNFKYDGAFTSVIESPALTEQEIKTKQDTSLQEVLYNTQIEVNKQKQEMKATIEKTTENSKQISQTTQTLTQIKNYVSEQQTSIDSVTARLTDTATNLNSLQQALVEVKESILTQSADAVEMLFKKTGIEDAVAVVENALNNAENQLNTITEYVRFEGAKIILGKSTSQSSLIIENDIIKFMIGDNISAYISENQLYITDSTILNKLQIRKWETKPDSLGNLNTRWVGDN